MSTPDFIDMLDALRAHDVRFLIVGGYAVGVASGFDGFGAGSSRGNGGAHRGT